MNVYIPFICIALGAALNWKGLPPKVLKAADLLTNLALFALMAVIGMNIGTSGEVMGNLDRIGFNCLMISLAALWCSVGITVILEKTVMPLEKIRMQLHLERGENMEQFLQEEAKSGISPLVIMMPACIATGIIAGYFWLQDMEQSLLDTSLTVCLFFLYSGAGIMLASNKSVFGYIKKLGLRVLFMPAGIFIGCLIGGAAAGWILGLPADWSVLSASGMGYYSLTGATMTETFGIEAGTYGFIVNILRDVLTVALLPILIKISKGSPIASGAGGCMDSMLVPVSRVVGPELSMVALISGTILTFFVPFWLPIGIRIFSILL